MSRFLVWNARVFYLLSGFQGLELFVLESSKTLTQRGRSAGLEHVKGYAGSVAEQAYSTNVVGVCFYYFFPWLLTSPLS